MFYKLQHCKRIRNMAPKTPTNGHRSLAVHCPDRVLTLFLMHNLELYFFDKKNTRNDRAQTHGLQNPHLLPIAVAKSCRHICAHATFQRNEDLYPIIFRGQNKTITKQITLKLFSFPFLGGGGRLLKKVHYIKRKTKTKVSFSIK